MPIKIPDQLPATKTLTDENIFVMTEHRAVTQDIRPLKILVLNLMPTKIATETQLSRLLGNSPLQVELTLMKTCSHLARHTSEAHMLAFYTTFDLVRDTTFDGMIITGAPVEHLPFEEVDYWPELQQIMDWSIRHVHSTLHICWGAQAGMYHHYGVNKTPLPEKMFGIFPHRVLPRHHLLFRGFDDTFMVPHSRHTTITEADIRACPHLRILATSEDAGVYAVESLDGRQIFLTGHSEYDPDTLDQEYRRDLAAGKPISMPRHYYPCDDPNQPPMVTWRGHAHLLFSNWLNYCVYQSTPYDLGEIR